MIQADEIRLNFDLAKKTAGVLALRKKYANRDLDLADACIGRRTKLTRDSQVVNLDRAGFAVYCGKGRDLIPVITPSARPAASSTVQ